MTTPIYPASLPCPLIKPYQVDVNMGVLRTPMDSGHARQRRLHRRMPHIFTLEFALSIDQLGRWQPWVNEFGYDWFQLDLSTMYSGQVRELFTKHEVRFISDLKYRTLMHGHVLMQVQAELSPAQNLLGPPQPSWDWIVGGSPGNPSTPDWYIGGKPATPSADIVNPGTPANPAALV